MGFLKDFKKARIVVRNKEDGTLIADANIVEWIPNRNVVRISSARVFHKGEAKVNCLIMTAEGLYEYEGVLREVSVANMREIGLHHGKNRENRQFTRYDIKAQGMVEGIVFGSQYVRLNKPIWLQTQNISTTGLLIRTLSHSFEVGDQAVILLEINGSQIRNTYEILRIQNSSLWYEEYGCRRIFPDSKKKGK